MMPARAAAADTSVGMPGPDVTLRSGSARYRVADGLAGVKSFAESVNRTKRIAGLPDTLNPGVIDPDKLVGLVAALPKLSSQTRATLSGHEMFLDSGGLGISAADPTHPEGFAKPFDLTIDPNSAPTVVATASVATDHALAQSRSKQAEAAVASADTAVNTMAKARSGPATREEALAEARRAAASRAWLINATAWAAADGADPAAQASLKAAQHAAQSFHRPSGAL